MIVGEPKRIADPKRRLPGRQLVQRRTQRVQVGPQIDGTARTARLFRCEIGQCADNPVVMGEVGPDLRRRRRQCEIDQVGITAGAGEQDVRRIDVPMNYPRACMSATTRARPIASRVSSPTSNGAGTSANEAPCTSSNKIDPG